MPPSDVPGPAAPAPPSAAAAEAAAPPLADSDARRQGRVVELLKKLQSKVVFGRASICSLHDSLTRPPWRLPADAHPLAGDVNRILEQSWRVQAAHVPDLGKGEDDDFQRYILSNSGFAVAGLIRYYVSLLPGFECHRDTLDMQPRLGIVAMDEREFSPYIWLDVCSRPVDNAFNLHSALYDDLFFERREHHYHRQDPFEREDPDKDLDYREEGITRQQFEHNRNLVQAYAHADHIEKLVVFSLGHAHYNPTFMMYHLMMLAFLKEAFGVAANEDDLERRWAGRCWQCGKAGSVAESAAESVGGAAESVGSEAGGGGRVGESAPESVGIKAGVGSVAESAGSAAESAGVVLKKCTTCLKARYCGPECQKLEWPRHKVLHKEIRNMKRLLGDKEQAA